MSKELQAQHCFTSLASYIAPVAAAVNAEEDEEQEAAVAIATAGDTKANASMTAANAAASPCGRDAPSVTAVCMVPKPTVDSPLSALCCIRPPTADKTTVRALPLLGVVPLSKGNALPRALLGTYQQRKVNKAEPEMAVIPSIDLLTGPSCCVRCSWCSASCRPLDRTQTQHKECGVIS